MLGVCECRMCLHVCVCVCVCVCVYVWCECVCVGGGGGDACGMALCVWTLYSTLTISWSVIIPHPKVCLGYWRRVLLSKLTSWRVTTVMEQSEVLSCENPSPTSQQSEVLSCENRNPTSLWFLTWPSLLRMTPCQCRAQPRFRDPFH